MRVLVVGASGAIGTRLIPQLTDRGHEVIGSSRSPAKAERLRALGAEPIVLDVLDASAARAAVAAARPGAIIYQATALADAGFPGISTAPSLRPTGCGPRAPTSCWPPQARRACAGSSPRASRPTATRARAGRSRPRTTRSTLPRPPRRDRPLPR
jgi:NAD dependent epimerase/dehydratase family